MFSRFLNTIFLFFIVTAIQGQQYEKKDFKVYRTKEGISNNHIFSAAQDAYGYIWVATERGLNRFDGSGFQQFYSDSSSKSLPQDVVHDLRWINKEDLAVLTFSGLHIINSKTLESYNYIIPADSLKDVLAVNQIYDIAADEKENIFIITSTGFYHFNKKKLVFRHDHFSRKTIETKVVQFGWEVVQVSDNILLLSTFEGPFIYNIAQKDIHPVGDKDGPFLRQLAQPKQVFKFIYKDKNYFIATSLGKKEMTLFDINKRTSETIKIPGSLHEIINANSSIFKFSDSLLGITAASKGFYKINRDHQKDSWVIDSTTCFENDFCTTLLFDKNGRLWVGTINGLYKQNIRGTLIEQILLPGEGAPIQRTISAFAVANNKLFTATALEGLYVFNRDSLDFLQQLMTPQKDFSYLLQLIKINEDTLMSARNGAMINTRNLEYKKIELENNISLAKIMGKLFKDSRNRILFTNKKSDTFYYKYPGENIFSVMRVPEFEKIVSPTQMAEDNEGNIWFGGHGGLIRLNDRSKKIDIFLDSFPAIKTQTKNIISNIVFDKNDKMYFGIGQNGLIIYDVKEKKSSHLTRINGLPDNTITTLYLHKNKTLWIGTESGLASYDLDSRKISSFGASDGMPTDPSTCHALYFDSAYGQLYAGFTHTIVRFDPTNLIKNQTPPDFFVESIDITGGTPFYHPERSISVPYKNNNVIVNLAAINYEDAPQQLYAYRLEKNDNENWQEIGTQNRIFLNDLPAGKHKLQLKVYIRNQSWPDQIKEIILIIRPPFWKTIWFYILIALAIAAIAYYLHRLRIKTVIQKADIDKQLAQTEMKALHSQMNPHFIFNCLNSIREMILNNENEQASLYLSKFARLIRITLDHSSRSFVSLEDTIDYLKRYLEMEHIRKSNFSFNINVDENLQFEEIFLPPMLIQPFIENAIWHGAIPGKELHLDLKFKREQDALVCIIDDNGMGIEISLKNKEPELNYQSVGISNIKQRIHVLNEKYNLQSTIEIRDKSIIHSDGDTGTIVTLHLPIKTNEPLL